MVRYYKRRTYYPRRRRRGSYYRRRRYRRRIINASSRSRVSIKTRDDCIVNLVQPINWENTVPCPINPWIIYAPDENDPYPYMFACDCASTVAFMNFSKIYDEVRLTRCQINIQLLTPLSEIGDSGLTIWTAWDRSTIVQDLGTGRYPGVQSIRNSPSSRQVTCLPHTVNSLVRSIWPSDLSERSQWVHTIKEQSTLVVHPYGANPTTLSHVVAPAQWFAEPSHHTFFCPTLWITVDPHVVSATVARNIKMHVTCSCTFEFRSPRFGQSNGDGRSLPREGIPVTNDDPSDNPKQGYPWQAGEYLMRTARKADALAALPAAAGDEEDPGDPANLIADDEPMDDVQGEEAPPPAHRTNADRVRRRAVLRGVARGAGALAGAGAAMALGVPALAPAAGAAAAAGADGFVRIFDAAVGEN